MRYSKSEAPLFFYEKRQNYMTCKGQLISEHIFLEIGCPKKQRRIVQTTKMKVYFCFGQLTNRRPTLRLSDLSKVH